MRLHSGVYICIATKVKETTRILSRVIYRVVNFEWICLFKPKTIHEQEEARYLRLLQDATDKYGDFYYLEGQTGAIDSTGMGQGGTFKNVFSEANNGEASPSTPSTPSSQSTSSSNYNPSESIFNDLTET